MRFPRTDRPLLAALAALLVLGQALCGCFSVTGDPVVLRAAAAVEKSQHLGDGHQAELVSHHLTTEQGRTGDCPPEDCPPDDCEHCTVSEALVIAEAASGFDGPAASHAILPASSIAIVTIREGWVLRAPRGPPPAAPTPISRFDVLIA